MFYYLLTFVLLILPVLNNAGNADFDTPVTNTTWFWPLLSVCIMLVLSVPCTVISVFIFCYYKKKLVDPNESSISSSSSSSSVQRQRRHHHFCHQHSHYAGGIRSPPPPYTTSERPENVFVTSSLPPPYESHVIDNESIYAIRNPTTTIINVEPVESIGNQSSNNPRNETILDVSSTLTNTSLQTFQV